MKRIAALLGILLCLALMSAAGEEPPDFAALTGMDVGQEKLDAGETIVRMTFEIQSLECVEPVISDDGEYIAAVWEALRGVRIAGATDWFLTDWYPAVTFVFSDGSAIRIVFDAHWLEADGRNYVLENDGPFWELVGDPDEDWLHPER